MRYMKKLVILICLGFIFITSGCLASIQNDSKYTVDEIDAAKQVVEEEVDQMKETCNVDVVKLWIEDGDRDSNEIVVYSNLEVYEDSGKGCAFNPNSTYEEWLWMLTRKDGNSPWVLQDSGYN